MDLAIQLDVNVVNTFWMSPLVINRLDVLTCKNKIKEFEAEHLRARRPLRQDAAWMVNQRWRYRGMHVSIRPFTDIQRSNRISQENMNELLDINNMPMIPDRTTGDGWSMRPFGAFNISMSRYAFLFEQLDIENIGDHRFIVCFADGYGGATKVLSKMTTDSQFLFVTSPTTSGEIPIPYGVEDPTSRNKVICDPIIRGRWDLTDISNMQALEEDYPYNVNMCICDAEVPHSGDSTNTYEKIWCKTVTYWLRNGSPNSLLILKVYMSNFDLILRIIARLRP